MPLKFLQTAETANKGKCKKKHPNMIAYDNVTVIQCVTSHLTACAAMRFVSHFVRRR